MVKNNNFCRRQKIKTRREALQSKKIAWVMITFMAFLLIFCVNLNLISAATWTASLNEDLLAYWKFDETSGTNAVDSVGGVHNGTITDAGIGYTGIIGNAYNFTGTQSVNITNNTMLETVDNFTIALWVNATAWIDNGYIWSYIDTSDSVPEIIIRYLDAGNGITASVTGDTLVSSTTPSLDKWVFLVLQTTNTTEGANITLWINNTIVAIDETISFWNGSATPGRHNFGDNIGATNDQLIDEIGFWTRYLEPQEIIDLYNGGVGLTYVDVGEVTIDNLDPANNTNLFQGDGNVFNINSTTVNTALVNATLYIDEVLNETKTISGTTNETIFIKNVSRLGEHNWSVLVCDDANECTESETRFFTLLPYKENSQTYNATTTETSTEDFIINLTYTSSSWTSLTAKLNWNATNYTGAQAGTGDDITFSTSVGIPSFNSQVATIPFHWILTFTNTTGSFQYDSNNYTQTVNPINFSLCNSTQTPFINFTTHNATNPFPVDNATFKVSWRITTSGGSTAFNSSFEDISETNNSWAFCFEDASGSYSVDADIEIDATDYAKNFHYLKNYSITNTTSNIDLYLLGDDLATATVLSVVDGAQNALPDTLISIQLYDIGTDTFYTIGMAKTSAQGEDLVYLNWYDSLYKFVLVRNSTTVLSTSPYKITETPQIFQVITEAAYDYKKFEDFEYSLTYNNVTQNFVLTFVKPSGDVGGGCLRVIKRNQTDDYTICSVCETSSSATVYCNIANQGNGTFIATFYAYGSPAKTIEVLTEMIGAISHVYDEIGNMNGTVMAIIFAGIVMSFFLVSPVLGVVGLLLGMLGTFALGFQPMDVGTFIGIALVGGIVIWFLTK